VRWVFVALLLAAGCTRPLPTPRPTAPAARAALAAVTAPSTAAPAGATPLHIGSWNTKRLGHGTKDLAGVAAILLDFDLVAVQEVMTAEVVTSLLAAMPTRRALLTDTPTPRDGTYREYFAFFYDPERLTPAMNTYVPDPGDDFVRDPYLACFVALREQQRLCLLTVHVVWGRRVEERKREILALDNAVRWAQDGDETSAWVVLGDFNRAVDSDADGTPEPEWSELLDRRGLRAPLVLAGSELPTTLGSSEYANAYDHVFVSTHLADRVVGAGRRDFVAQACSGDFERCRRTISDHAPVFLDLLLPPAPR
jgi:endonuclease/exonuclease/phosphatase family metal-dependent hydrolase